MAGASNSWGLNKKKPAPRKKTAKRGGPTLIRRVEAWIKVMDENLEVAQTVPGRLFLSPIFKNDYSALTLRFVISQSISQGQNILVEIPRPEGKITIRAEVLWCMENPNFTKVLAKYAYPYRIEILFKKEFNKDNKAVHEPAPNVSQMLFDAFFKKAA